MIRCCWVFEGYILVHENSSPSLWFDFGCSNELHGLRPYTNDCGLFKVSSLKSYANSYECFKYVVSAHVSGEVAKLHLFVGSWGMGAGWWVKGTCLTPLSEYVIPLRLKITMQILLSGPGSGDQGLGYQQIHHLWTYASLPVPPAKSSPPLLPGPG